MNSGSRATILYVEQLPLKSSRSTSGCTGRRTLIAGPVVSTSLFPFGFEETSIAR